MGNDNKVKNIILVVLVIGLVGMTIAYAALTQTLYIRDNEVTITTDWNVHFANTAGHTNAVASSTGGGATTAIVNQQPTLTSTVISGLRATFRKPGDKVVYQFDIVNEGGIDAKLSTATYSTPTCTSSDANVSSSDLATFCQKINYSIVYTGTNTAPATNDDLLVYDEDDSSTYSNVRHCTLTVELDPNTEITDFPGGDITVSNIEATFVYVQK